MLDFCTLIVELIKIQDYLGNHQVEIKPIWAEDYHNDRLVISSRKNFSICQFTIERYNWDHRCEFMLIDSSGQHHYIIDPETEQPKAIDKVHLLSNIWATTYLTTETREFGQQVVNLLRNLEKKLNRQKSILFQEISRSKN